MQIIFKINLNRLKRNLARVKVEDYRRKYFINIKNNFCFDIFIRNRHLAFWKGNMSKLNTNSNAYSSNNYSF